MKDLLPLSLSLAVVVAIHFPPLFLNDREGIFRCVSLLLRGVKNAAKNTVLEVPGNKRYTVFLFLASFELFLCSL